MRQYIICFELVVKHLYFRLLIQINISTVFDRFLYIRLQFTVEI